MVKSSDKTQSSGEGNAKHSSILTFRMSWTVWKDKKLWKMNSPGRQAPKRLLEKNGEIATERMKRGTKSKKKKKKERKKEKNTQLWMWLVMEVKASGVKNNIA